MRVQGERDARVRGRGYTRIQGERGHMRFQGGRGHEGPRWEGTRASGDGACKGLDSGGQRGGM